MKRTRPRVDLGIVLLGLLAIATLVLSGEALTAHSGAARAADSTPLPSFSPLSDAKHSPRPSRSPSSPASQAQTAAASTSPSASAHTVVVLGDGNSSGNSTDTWIGMAAKKLGWTDVVNLSAPGRGYVKQPRSCGSTPTPCANFEGSIGAVVEAHPDLVITFGGTADGDYDLTPLADQYYADLHKALPQATLVAVSPVTTLAPVPYYFTLNTHAIDTAATKAGALFVNVGQPGSGDGDSLSHAAQSAIAAKIVAALS